jgi:hypothetical protein
MDTVMTIIALTFSVLAAASVPCQEPVRIASATSAIEADPAFAEMRGRLEAALRSRRVEALRPLLASRVRTGIETTLDADAAIRALGLTDRDASWWAALEGLVAIGGHPVSANRYVYPFFADNPTVTVASGWCVSVGVVTVRTQPAATAAEGPVLNNHVVRRLNDTPAGWLQIGLADGGSGFVRVGECVGPMDGRIELERREERWVIVTLTAAD